ncbi:asparagine synthase family amidotransferase [Chloroherpeton thalassium ATCC 35110]|uniref:asparagine synthase (glutamine-hydrolyzing) n=1 Tax=Chloroherpeton thalassium (strain ATCC 35110 / GB-78) TaxID=517418 RepID=B3QY65_CHLT3|nr:N-acetylglutaminylglutamine amidotransferase [Chloroherpeton thalassium]ACF15031.1 asparagine synthase family amidotransferase [Chloroherpeton thalassium ATCC 35110]
MCGICGEIRFDQKSPSLASIERMNAQMERRGPDGAGVFQQKNLAFGHRRLKIIDVSERSQQPMIDNDLGLSIVFNGCIYNYPELREALKQKGYQFFSGGDTEVILKAYHAWGMDFVQHLQGMFAFAIWERDSGNVIIARDRLGIKPFYYVQDASSFRFASSLPALLASGNLDTEIDPAALNYYMSFHAVVPAPNTIIKGVRRFPPATIMKISPDGKTKAKQYWTLNFDTLPEEKNLSEADWKERVREALLLAVRRRMVADVPVGVLLSGGLDSSLVVAMLAGEGQTGLNTFSVGFENVGIEEGNEFKYSDIIAERFGTTHHKIFVQNDELLKELPNCIAAMNEPMVSHDVIGFYLLSRTVSEHVKAVQSGQGADEIFGGYHWYPPMLEADAGSAVATYKQAFFDRDFEEYKQAVDARFIQEDFAQQFVQSHFAAAGATRPIDKALRLDTTIMLTDDPVKRVDNMTMAWGVEARVPFLDHELVEVAARVPAEYKIKSGGKHILKSIGYDMIPKEVIDRPKGYFPVPGLKYIDGEYLDMVHDVLGSQKAKNRGIFNRNYLDTLLANPKEHITPLRGSKLWQVTLLEYWLQTHNL